MVDDLPRDIAFTKLDTASFQGTHPATPGFVRGRVYVFRKTRNTTNEDIAIRLFPQRLSRIGARVTKAPASSRELTYLFMGGPLYQIQFEKDGKEGMIFNRVHTSEKDEGNWEELVFAFR